MAQSYQLISAQTLTANTASVTFSNIPQNYTDLLLKISVRTTNTQYGETIRIRPNNLTTNGSARVLRAFNGTSTSSYAYSNVLATNNSLGATATANTFASIDVYILNYTSSNYKSFSGDAVSEDNASDGRLELTASLWSDSAAITSLVLDNDAGSPFSFTANSTFTLYGIGGSRASGGTITADGNYTYHTFTSTGTFTALERIRGAEALVIAGGGGGKADGAGGGGAGGVVWVTSQTLNAANTYTIVVGGGGSGAVMNGAAGTSGSNSQLASFTAIGGGLSDTSGGSGGGGSGRSNAAGGVSTQTTSGTNFIGYGNSGGNARVSGSGATAGGGGGGAGAAGTSAPNTAPGAGGIGTSLFSSWGLATSTGSLVSGIYYYAGGGGGGSDTYSGASGGSGGGGTGGGGSSADSAAANTGGGGGGGSGQSSGSFRNGGSGGSGLVIIRYPNS